MILISLPELFDQSLLSYFLNEPQANLDEFLDIWLASTNQRLRPYHYSPVAVLEQKELIYAGRFDYITIGDTTHLGSGFHEFGNIIAPELLSPIVVVSPYTGVRHGDEETYFDLDGSFEFRFDPPDLPLASN